MIKIANSRGLCALPFISLLGVITLGSATSLPGAHKSIEPLTADIHAEAQRALQEFGVPGLAIALIQNGSIAWMKAYGLADTAARTPVTPDTFFNAGSISKTATAWGVMRLVERRKVDLDKPVNMYLKRWQLQSSKYDASQATVRRVLSHTAGLSNHDYHGWDSESPLPAIEDSLSGKTGTGEVHLVSAPGTAFAYSGAGYAILQLLIEDVTGRRFREYMKAEVFDPLRMRTTVFGLPDNWRRSMAVPYGPFLEPLPTLRYNELAAAGLTTSLRDMATLAAAGLKTQGGALPGRGILHPQALKLMHSASPGSRWADHDLYGPSPQYGLGYTVRPQQFAGREAVGHGGSNRGWESFFQIVPASGDGIVVFTNSSNGSAAIASLLCAWRRWGSEPGRTVQCPAIGIRHALIPLYLKEGMRSVLERYRQLRHDLSATYDFSAHELNAFGYELLRRGDVASSIEIFRLNAEQFPNDWNVHDSLGEALLKAGEKAEAIASYRKSLELNPGNENSRNVLRSLGLHHPQ